MSEPSRAERIRRLRRIQEARANNAPVTGAEAERRNRRFEIARRATYDFFQDAADRLAPVPVIGQGASALVRGGSEIALGDRTRSAAPGASGAALNAYLWGAGNEAQGALAAAVQPIRSAMGEQGVSPGQAYVNQSQAAQAELDRQRAEAPVSTMALEGVTGALNPLNAVGAGYISRAGGLLGGAARSAAVAAPVGATVGFFEDRGGLVDRLDGAAFGAGTGAVLGFGAPLVIGGVSRLGMPTVRFAARAYRNLRGNRPLSGEQAGAWSMILREAQEAGLSEQDIMRRLDDLERAGLDDEQAMFELLGGNAVERARGGVATGNPDALQGRDRINARQSRQPQRVQQRLREGLGSDGSEFEEVAQTLETPSPLENQLYDEFRALPGINNAELDRLMQVPMFRRAVASAQASSQARDGASMVVDGEVSTDALQRVYSRLGELAREAEGRGRAIEAGDIFGLQNRLRNVIDNAYPGSHASARGVAEGRLSAKEALEFGRDIFRTENVRNTQALARRVQGMTPEQLQAFRIGVARGVVDQINTAPRSVVPVNDQVITSDARDAGNAIARFWNRADRQEALRAAFGDETTFERFVRAMAIEGDRAAIFPRISPRTQGPSTFANARAAAISDGVQDVADASSGNWLSPILRRFQRSAAQGNPMQEAEIQRILWDTVPNRRAELISQLEIRGLISRQQGQSLRASLQLAAPATSGAINATQN